jgi:hypothetical protein
VGLAHGGARPGPANGFGPLGLFVPRPKQGKPKPAARWSIPPDRRRAAGEGRAGVLARADGKPIGVSNGEGAHWSLVCDGDGGRRRGSSVRG